MNRKQYLLMILLAVVTGFIGGAVSNYIIQPVFAQKEPKPHKLVIAEEFRLVDKEGKVRAHLRLGERLNTADTAELRLLRRSGTGGVLIYASDYSSEISLFGSGPNISMAATTFPDGTRKRLFEMFEMASLKIGFHGRNLLKEIKTKQPPAEDESYIEMKAGGSTSGPRLELADKRGKVRAVLGGITLEGIKTGTTTERSAASLVLFDKKGSVFWSTPE